MESVNREITSSIKVKEDRVTAIQFLGFKTIVNNSEGDLEEIIYDYPEFDLFVQSAEILIYTTDTTPSRKILLIYEKGKRYKEVLSGEWIVLEHGNLSIISNANMISNYFERGERLFEE